MATYDDFQNKPAQKKTSVVTVLLIVFGILFGCGFCCCGGFFLFGKQAVDALFGVIATEVQSRIAATEPIQEHIGDIQSLEFSWSATFAVQDKHHEHIAFEIKGTKGNGIVIVKSDDSNNSDKLFDGAILRLPSGEEFELIAPGGGDVPAEAIDGDAAGKPDDGAAMPAEEKPATEGESAAGDTATEKPAESSEEKPAEPGATP